MLQWHFVKTDQSAATILGGIFDFTPLHLAAFCYWYTVSHTHYLDLMCFRSVSLIFWSSVYCCNCTDDHDIFWKDLHSIYWKKSVYLKKCVKFLYTRDQYNLQCRYETQPEEGPSEQEGMGRGVKAARQSCSDPPTCRASRRLTLNFSMQLGCD